MIQELMLAKSNGIAEILVLNKISWIFYLAQSLVYLYCPWSGSVVSNWGQMWLTDM